MYESHSATIWDTINSYTGGAKRAGYFLVGGIVLYMILYQRNLVSDMFLQAAALDNDPHLNKVNVIPGLSAPAKFSMPGEKTKYKRKVSTLLKKKIAAAQQWRCASCSTLLDETYEVDHKIALENGGSNDPSNLWALCPHCHRKKTVAERIF